MRRIPLQCDAMAEVFTKARDASLTPDLSDATLHDLVEARKFGAPSKAHLKRNERAKRDHFVDPVVHKPVSERTLKARTQNDWFKEAAAIVGGSRTVAPTYDGTLYDAQRRGLLNYVEPKAKQEQRPMSFADHMGVEQARIDAERVRLERDAAKARAAVETPLERAFRLANWSMIADACEASLGR